MFSKADKSSRHAASTNSSHGTTRVSAPSIISADLRITGDLECSGDIQIDGVVNGDIQSRNIVIGEGASVTGSLQAEAVQVFGRLIGQIKADTVTLERTAHVAGDILHKAIAIAQGAFLEGAIKRIDSTPPVAAAPAAAAPADDELLLTATTPAPAAEEKAAKADEAKVDAEASDKTDDKVQRLQAAS